MSTKAARMCAAGTDDAIDGSSGSNAGTDALLIRIRVHDAGAALTLDPARLKALAQQAGACDVQHAAALAHPMAYVRLTLSQRRVVHPPELATRLIAALAPEISAKHTAVSRLQQLICVEGACAGEAPSFHYVVETTPAPGWEDEFQRWYDEEHLPGLARVPGCIRAQRFRHLDGHPTSYACYDLESAEVLGSPAWLAVRASAWSDRVRPHFTRTVRTMFRIAGVRLAGKQA